MKRLLSKLSLKIKAIKEEHSYNKIPSNTLGCRESKHKCKNCQTEYWGNYCSNCGQSCTEQRISGRTIWDNFLGGLTNISRGFGFTILELFTRPGYMINDYIKGKRVIYARPFQMLFVLAAIYGILSEIIIPLSKDEVKETKTIEKVEPIPLSALFYRIFTHTV